ncbi:MAG: hypothetical protein J5794_01400 [Lachnospiraceae bacterium]|nr:hypothetical protein [Lachnospiraceae bacterium]
MEVWVWILIIIGALLLFGILPLFVMGLILYRKLLVRTSKDIWNRGMSMPSDPEYKLLFEDGQRWRDEYLDYMQEVHIVNDKLNLYGEYFDFGSKSAVIILPGRMETCLYSDFYAEPYANCGLNVLTIDNRAHGLSDGRYNSLGFLEHRDIIAWAKYLHDERGIEKIVLHGVCIGCSTAVFTATSPECPEYVKAVIAEGMYVNFDATYRLHIEEQGHRYFPIGPIALGYLKLTTGADVVHDGPLKRIPQMKIPLLMLHSREDQYSLPEKAEELFKACGSEVKQLVWFDTGAHSRIRIHTKENRAAFDEAIKRFLGVVL